MTEKIAFIFPGQGSQTVGMGRDIIEKFPEEGRLLSRACDILDYDLKKIMFQGPEEELNDTRNTQPAVYTLSTIVNNILSREGIKPSTVAGHSLGEYSALYAAGVFNFFGGLKLVRQRGVFMNEALPAGKGTMAAIIGLPVEELRSILASYNEVCEIANFNTPNQIVVSGTVKGIKEIIPLAREAGARKVIELDVSGPFHSSLMKPARKKLAAAIEKVNFREASVPVVSNVRADCVTDPDTIKEALLGQLTGSVRWLQSMELMITEGIDTFVEVGPGRTLRGMMRRIDRSVEVYSTDRVDRLEKVIHELGGNR